MPMYAIVLPPSVKLYGKGSDRFKYVSGLTIPLVEKCLAIGGDKVILLQHSHTGWCGERYKQVIPYDNYKRWKHRCFPNRKIDDGQVVIIQELTDEN